MPKQWQLVLCKILLLVLLVEADRDFRVGRVFAERESDVGGDGIVVPGIRTYGRRQPRTPSPLTSVDSPIYFPGAHGGPPVTLPPTEEVPVNPTVVGSQPPLDLELPEDFNKLEADILRHINGISDISGFASLFNLSLPAEDEDKFNSTLDFDIGGRFGGSTQDEGETFEMANCKPELVTVPLDLPNEPNTMFFPTCIRLEQCGGCCYGPLLTCTPTVTKVVKVKVLKVSTSSSTNSNSSRRRGSTGRRRRRQSQQSYHIVEAVKHTACSCGCKVREEDCHSDLHTYFEGECACICKNRDEQKKCEAQNSTKYWDNNSCNCFCRNEVECGTGEYFSQASCSCERLAARHGLDFSSAGTEA